MMVMEFTNKKWGKLYIVQHLLSTQPLPHICITVKTTYVHLGIANTEWEREGRGRGGGGEGRGRGKEGEGDGDGERRGEGRVMGEVERGKGQVGWWGKGRGGWWGKWKGEGRGEERLSSLTCYSGHSKYHLYCKMTRKVPFNFSVHLQ